jgi:hypothetical protein
MRAFIAAVAIVISSAAFAQGQGQITGFLRPTIGIYDKDGNLLRRVAKTELPAKPAVVHRNKIGQLGISLNGQTVYVRNSEVQVKGLPDPCATVSQTARPAGQAVAGSEGIGSGMSNKSSPCVRHAQ